MARIPLSWGRLGDARRRFITSSFLQNTLALMFGTVATQGIIFLVSPLLSRIFGLEDFGHLANYNAWVAILALLSTLRYEHAIFVAQGADQTSGVLALSIALTIVSVATYFSIAFGVTLLDIRVEYINDISKFIMLIPLGVLLTGWSSLLTQLNIKAGNFRRLAMVAAGQVVVTVTAQIVLGLLKVENALIVGTMIGFLASGVALSGLSVDRDMLASMRRNGTITAMKASAARHLNFPRYAMGADAINILSQQFIPVFVLALFNPATAGLYAFATRVVRVPLIVVATAITGALRKEAVDSLHGKRSLAALFSVTVRTSFLVAVGPCLIILFYSTEIFSTVFGDKWAEAGTVARILSPGMLLEFVAFPLSVIFLVTSAQRYTFLIQILGFSAVGVALFVGKQVLNDFMSTCYLISGIMVLVNLASIVVAGRVAHGRSEHQIERPGGNAAAEAP